MEYAEGGSLYNGEFTLRHYCQVRIPPICCLELRFTSWIVCQSQQCCDVLSLTRTVCNQSRGCHQQQYADMLCLNVILPNQVNPICVALISKNLKGLQRPKDEQQPLIETSQTSKCSTVIRSPIRRTKACKRNLHHIEHNMDRETLTHNSSISAWTVLVLHKSYFSRNTLFRIDYTRKNTEVQLQCLYERCNIIPWSWWILDSDWLKTLDQCTS